MDELQQLYQQAILEHSRNRNGSGTVPKDAIQSHQTNPSCGDEVTLTAAISNGDTIESLTWDGDGCSISQASVSMMNDLVTGKSLSEVNQLWQAFDGMMHSRGQEIDEDVLDTLEDAAALQGTSQFPNRVKCALLGWMALRDVLAKIEGEASE